MLAHGNILSNVSGVLQVISGSGDLSKAPDLNEHAFSFLPLAHAFERVVYYTLTAGVSSIAYPENAGHFARDMKQVKPTIIAAAPLLSGS